MSPYLQGEEQVRARAKLVNGVAVDTDSAIQRSIAALITEARQLLETTALDIHSTARRGLRQLSEKEQGAEMSTDSVDSL